MKLKLHLVFRTNNRFYFYSTNILLTSKSRENHIKSGYCRPCELLHVHIFVNNH